VAPFPRAFRVIVVVDLDRMPFGGVECFDVHVILQRMV
jgi:hypothetical protein